MKAAIALVSGRPNSGKTACLLAVIARASARGLTCSGLVSHGLWNNGRKTGYMLEAVATGERRLLAEGHPDQEHTLFYGRFYFSQDIFAWGNTILGEAAGSGVVVVDECGPLEMNGSGLWPGMEYLILHHTGPLLISVRPSLQADLRRKIQSMHHRERHA